MTPLSGRNPRVSAARRLLKRGYRTQARAFLVEGPQAVGEALAHEADRPGHLTQVFVTGDAHARVPDLVRTAHGLDVPVDVVGAVVFSELAQTVSPQGILGVCSFIDRPLDDVLATQPRSVVVLAHVRDPGNAGTVIRTADAAGCDAVILTEASVDPYNGKCVRATAGSLFHVPLVTGTAVDVVVAQLRAAGLRVVAADGAGTLDLDDEVDSGRLAAPTAWVFGNEAWGLPEATARLCDAVVRVPIHGRAESLNLATAAAVCLYAGARAQRRKAPLPH